LGAGTGAGLGGGGGAGLGGGGGAGLGGGGGGARAGADLGEDLSPRILERDIKSFLFAFVVSFSTIAKCGFDP
jgi:hypothetical protein